MRLPLLSPAALDAEQKGLYDEMVATIDASFGELITRGKDGALIGPFNGWLHFPQFGGSSGFRVRRCERPSCRSAVVSAVGSGSDS